MVTSARPQLSDHFTCPRLLRFVFPSMIMMIFTSIYSVVDGFFVSNFTGKTTFAAINFIWPLLGILGTAGFMFGTGGSALIARTLGEGKSEEAQRQFSLIVYATMVTGVLLGAVGLIIVRPVAMLLGATGQLLEDSVRYASIFLVGLPAYVLQYAFQCLFVTAGKPSLGLIFTAAAGVTNMVLDAVFVGLLGWGLEGAAAATVLSQCVGGLLPLIYFFRPNPSLLRLGKTRMNGRALGQTCLNGSSELMSNIAISLVSMLYNAQLLRYIGENGIAAYGVLMYVSMIFQAMFIGYAVGSAPIVSFHYGAGNRDELKGLLRRGAGIISCFAVGMLALAMVLAVPLSRLFVGYDAELMALTVQAFRIFSWSFLFSGFAIFGSSFFTALNNGPVSAAISFLRTLVFQLGAVLLLPLLWGINGIWASTVAAEVMAAAVTAVFLWGMRKRYGY